MHISSSFKGTRALHDYISPWTSI